MKITYNNTEINFFEEFEPREILMSLSGGLDSSAAMYLICTHFPDVSILPYTVRVVDQPVDALCALDIAQWMKETFPNVDIKELREYEVDDLDPDLMAAARIEYDQHIRDGIPTTGTPRGLVKKELINEIAYELHLEFPKAVKVSGMTCNPDDESMKQVEGFYEQAERRRDQKLRPFKTWKDPWRMYQPFLNVDKKFIADIYKQHGLMETLFPLTSSCVGVREKTNYFTEPCKNCFWCHEKYWAFGKY